MADFTILKLDPLEDAWVGLGDTRKIYPEYNPLKIRHHIFEENPGLLELDVLRRPEYMGYTVWVLLGIKLVPFQSAILYNLWKHSFPMLIGSRGMSKSFLLAIYSILRCLFNQNYKVVLVGGSFRQSKIVFEYIDRIWSQSPVLRSICDNNSGPHRDPDRWYFNINNSQIIAIPIGPSGDKIRGLRANTIICDEFASLNVEVYETVIAPFASVSSSPDTAVVQAAKRKAMEDYGIKIEEEDFELQLSNQSIISGTADYHFSHFYDYFERYKRIIESKGDPDKIDEIFKGETPPNFDWRDYCVIRIPYTLLPPGFMEEKVIARAKATMNSAIFSKEFEACFQVDSDGFFKRSLVESCVAHEKNIAKPEWPSWCPAPFDPMVRGKPDKKYVMGIDPASERDNFAICVLEVHDTHARVAHVWTTNKEQFSERRKAGLAGADDYYSFCSRRIRDLMAVFPTYRIALDMGGGGIAVRESLADRNKLQEGEEPIWEVIDYEKEKDSDRYLGLHIIEPIQFARTEWVSEANHGMRKDFEDRRLIFPRFDALTIDLAAMDDLARIKLFEKENAAKTLQIYDSLEDCAWEIEQLKDELTQIIMRRTLGVNGREKWLAPEIKLEGNVKITARKDRYSALLMANAIARKLKVEVIYKKKEKVIGGFIRDFQGKGGEMYSGPDWFTQGVKGI